MADKPKEQKTVTKTTPATPQHNPILCSPVQSRSVKVARKTPHRPPSDYSRQIDTWIALFRDLNRAVGRLYTMCGRENLQPFTEGVIQSLLHSVDEFKALKLNQSVEAMDISDPQGTVDGELVKQYLEDGLSPAEALVLLVRERAECSDDEKFEMVDEVSDESSWDLSSFYSFGSEKKVRSMSQGRMERRSIEEKLLTREKLSPNEVKRRAEDKMSRAQFKRSLAARQRQERAVENRRKFKKVKEQMQQQLFEKRNAIQLQILLKQSKADERYEAHLNSIRQRAKDETLKSNEIMFINEKKIEEKKMNLDQKLEETRERRTALLDGVKNKQAERVQKEEAVNKRRQELEIRRESRLMSTQQKLEEAESRRHKILEDKKNRAEELAKRRNERTQQKAREDAKEPQWETGSASSIDEEVPSLLAYRQWQPSEENVRVTFSKKKRKLQRMRIEAEPIQWCSVCNYVLVSKEPVGLHCEGDKHKTELSRDIIQGNIAEPVFVIASLPDLQHQQELYMRKRAKKIKQAAANRATKHEKACIIGKETTGVNKNRLQKLCIDLEKSTSNHIDYSSVEGILKDTIKLLDQRKEADLHVIRQLKFIPCLIEVIKKAWSCPRHEVKFILRLLDTVIKFLTIFSGLSENRTYVIISNRIIPIIELLSFILAKPVKVMMEITYLPQIFNLLTTHLKHRTPPECWNMRELFVEYLLNCGLITRLKQRLRLLQGPLDLSSNSFSLLLLKCVGFLESLINFPGWGLGNKPAFEVSVYLTENFIHIFRETELAGIPYLLLSLLLHDGIPKSANQFPPIPQTLIALSILSMRFLNNLARLHLPLFQELLSGEEYAEHMYHLFNYLLRYCTEHLETGPEDVRELLHEVTLLIGYFVMLNPKNQSMMNRGETCILQRLCGLPIAYFTNKKYMTVLYPSLISICYDHRLNLSILHQEMSVDMLVGYIRQQSLMFPEPEDEEAKEHLQPKKTPSISSSGSSSKSILNAASFKLEFVNRFPKDLWPKAIEFFQED